MGEVKYESFEGFTDRNKHQMVVSQNEKDRNVTVFPPKAAKGKPIWPFPGFGGR